jgi:hypothetical protein
MNPDSKPAMDDWLPTALIEAGSFGYAHKRALEAQKIRSTSDRGRLEAEARAKRGGMGHPRQDGRIGSSRRHPRKPPPTGHSEAPAAIGQTGSASNRPASRARSSRMLAPEPPGPDCNTSSLPASLRRSNKATVARSQAQPSPFRRQLGTNRSPARRPQAPARKRARRSRFDSQSTA